MAFDQTYLLDFLDGSLLIPTRVKAKSLGTFRTSSPIRDAKWYFPEGRKGWLAAYPDEQTTYARSFAEGLSS